SHLSLDTALIIARTPYAILDANDRIIAVLLGRPKEHEDESRTLPEHRWTATTSRVAVLFEDLRRKGLESGALTDAHLAHRRGKYAALSFGNSYGGGATVPGELCQTEEQALLVAILRASTDLQRVAGFQSDGLASYVPKGYEHMVEGLNSLYERYPSMRPNFRTSAYPAATANLGPDTTTLPHKDDGNYPSLACAITALGGFDHKRGGHIVLTDLKLKIEFPSGSTILLSSAGLEHGNLPIQPGESRYSFTQYCPGGLLRWVRHGFRPAGGLTKAQRLALDGPAGEGWRRQLTRLSKYDELLEDRKWLIEREDERRRSRTVAS
ncbi:hypothetical protein FA95DRAFT_1492950, partial [Auriscalpium vulgare]